MNFIDLVKQSAEKKIIYSHHALDEMTSDNEMVTADEVRDVIFSGEIVEDYPNDKRGHSCLMFGVPSTGKPIHLVCAPKDEYLAIITVYRPTLDKWEPSLKVRRKR